MNLTVLAIDDDAVNLRLAAEVLTTAGHTVHCAVDAEQALELLAEKTVDIVLTDISLPRMNGLELTRLLKSDQRWRRIPVIAMTASAMRGDETRILNAGCDGYLAKPLDTRQLSLQLLKVLQSTSGVRESS